MVLRERKSILKELSFAKLVSDKSDFVNLVKSDCLDLVKIDFVDFMKTDFSDLVKFNFLDYVKFVTIDRFSILPTIIILLVSLALFDTSWFFLISIFCGLSLLLPIA